MQRISEQDEAGHGKSRISGRDVRGDPAAHRLAADEEAGSCAIDPLANRVNDCVVTGVEHRPAIRHSTVLFGVQEVEGDDVETERGQRAREMRP